MSNLDTDERRRLDFQLSAPLDEPDLEYAPDWWFGDDDAMTDSMAAAEEMRS